MLRLEWKIDTRYTWFRETFRQVLRETREIFMQNSINTQLNFPTATSKQAIGKIVQTHVFINCLNLQIEMERN